MGKVAAGSKRGQRANGDGSAGDEGVARQLRMIGGEEAVHRRDLLRRGGRGINLRELRRLGRGIPSRTKLVLHLRGGRLELRGRHGLVMLLRYLLDDRGI